MVSILFFYFSGWRKFVHHAGVVGADELGVEGAAGGAVDGVAVDLAVTVDDALLTREELILSIYMEGVGLWLLGAELATEVFPVDP